MHLIFRLLLIAPLLAAPCLAAESSQPAPVAIAIHAGAGTIKPEDLTEEREREIRAHLEQAVRAGHAVLQSGGPGLEAVTAAIKVLEDSPHFNAGKGAEFNAEGHNEMDAAIMDGATLNAGAVAAVRRIRNPIDLALRVLTHSRHVMMIGEGAEQFAAEQGFGFVEPDYFHTEYRWQKLQEKKAEESAMVFTPDAWYSTVGAVTLDRQGNLTAGTSTGGLTNKRWGRVGDTPIIGAGTYANNANCAVSGTGTGEFFIRHVVAHSICTRVAGGQEIGAAASALMHEVLAPEGGDGGVIAMDAKGNIATPFNTTGMYRAWIDRDGRFFVGIYTED